MKVKLIALLKPKFANKGFSQKTIEGLADLLAKNLTDESTDDEINTAIEGVTPYAEIMQAENTRYANEVKSKLPKPNPASPEVVIPPVDETPTDKMLRELLQKVTKLESEKSVQSRTEKFVALMGKDIPSTRYSRIPLPETDDELSALADEIKAEHAAELQGSVNGGLGGDKPAGSAAAAAAAAAEKVSPIVAAFIEKSSSERKTA